MPNDEKMSINERRKYLKLVRPNKINLKENLSKISIMLIFNQKRLEVFLVAGNTLILSGMFSVKPPFIRFMQSTFPPESLDRRGFRYNIIARGQESHMAPRRNDVIVDYYLK